MFWKNAKSNYTSRQTDKAPDALPGVRKNRLSFPLRAEKYGLSIWMGSINIPILPSKSCAQIRSHSAARPRRGISHLSSMKPSLRMH